MRNIVVTGDSGGLGSSIVELIVKSSEFNVIGLSRSENQVIKSLKEKLGDRYKHFYCDLDKPEELKKLYKEKIRPLGDICGLVNNSAYAYDDIVTNAKINDLERMIRINLTSPVMLTKLALRDMLRSGVKGSIVHISSVCAHTGYKGLSMYAMTKGGIESFSKTVAREWGERGIRSNCVAPGFMDTNISSSLSKEQKSRIYNRTSLKEDTKVESVAEMVVFLLSDKSKSITGTVMHVDNGTI
jgi:3-oxoacyl-[acyl-carrier protein] reductase